MGKDEQDVLNSFIPGNEVFSVLNKIKTCSTSPLRVVLLTKNFDKNFEEIVELFKGKGIKFALSTKNKSQILWAISFDEEEGVAILECPYCNKKFKTDIEEKYELKYYLVEFLDSNLLILITNSKNNFEKLINTFNSVYPLVSRIFYRAGELKFILNKIEGFKNIEVVGRECVVKRLYNDKKTVVTYEEDTINRFFEKAKKDDSWVDSIEVLIKPLGVIRFSRRGVILYSRPFDFTAFFEIVVKTILNELLIKRRDELKSKSRTIQSPNIKPILMKFDKDYFAEDENIYRLVSRLNECDSYEVSIIYSSKCLAHIEGYDYANGGGFDIYINQSNELSIVPQTQINEIALEGIVIKISDIFEGSIE